MADAPGRRVWGVGRIILSGAVSVALSLSPAIAQETTPPASPEPQSDPKARRVDPRADEILKKMSALIAAAPRFALEAEETFDEVSDNAPRLQLTNVRRVGVEKPSRFAADATANSPTPVIATAHFNIEPPFS